MGHGVTFPDSRDVMLQTDGLTGGEEYELSVVAHQTSDKLVSGVSV